jgi:hypothetical protein
MLAYTEAAKSIHATITHPEHPCAYAPVTPEVVALEKMDEEDTLTFLDSVRPELYGISAVFGSMVLDQLVNTTSLKLKPFGIGFQVPDLSPQHADLSAVTATNHITDLIEPLRHTIKHAQRECFEAYSENEYFNRWYSRFDEILGFFRDFNIDLNGNYDSPEAFLDGGFGTSVHSNIWTLDLVNRAHLAYAPDSNLEDIIESARRAKRIPYKLAGTVPLQQIMQTMQSLRGMPWLARSQGKPKPFSMEQFIVKRDKGNPHILDIGYKTQAQADLGSGMPLNEVAVTLSHIACPGMVDFSKQTDDSTHSVGRMYMFCTTLVTNMALWGSQPSQAKSETVMF